LQCGSQTDEAGKTIRAHTTLETMSTLVAQCPFHMEGWLKTNKVYLTRACV